ERTPLDWVEPGRMKIRLVPMPRICDVTWACAPCPIDISETTAHTPMIMPSIVRKVRSLLALRAPIATRTDSYRLMSEMPPPPAPPPLRGGGGRRHVRWI